MSGQKVNDNILKLVSINKHYLCGGGSLEVGKAIPRITNEDLQRTLKQDIINEWHKGGLGGFNILSNVQFAVYHFLGRIGCYYAGDFLPVSNDKKFLREIREIWNSLISKCFFGTVWVACGEDLLQQERAAVEKTDVDWYIPQHFPKSKIRLYVREKRNKPGGGYTFKSVWTNATNIDIDPEKAVCVTVNGLDNFLGWYKIILDFLSGHNRTINLFAAATKHIKVDVTDQTAFKEEEGKILNDYSPVLALTRKDMFISNKYEPIEWVKMESVQAAIAQNQGLRDLVAAFYGFFGPIVNSHGEEPNQASTFVDMKHVNNVQQSHLLILQAFAANLREAFPDFVPEDFDIIINTNRPHEDPMFEDMTNYKGPNEEPNEQGTNQNSEKFHTTR